MHLSIHMDKSGTPIDDSDVTNFDCITVYKATQIYEHVHI